MLKTKKKKKSNLRSTVKGRPPHPHYYSPLWHLLSFFISLDFAFRSTKYANKLLYRTKKKNPTSFTTIKEKWSHPTSTSSSSFSFTKKTQTDMENALAPLRLHAKSSFVTRLDGLWVSLNLNTKIATLYCLAMLQKLSWRRCVVWVVLPCLGGFLFLFY